MAAITSSLGSTSKVAPPMILFFAVVLTQIPFLILIPFLSIATPPTSPLRYVQAATRIYKKRITLYTHRPNRIIRSIYICCTNRMVHILASRNGKDYHDHQVPLSNKSMTLGSHPNSLTIQQTRHGNPTRMSSPMDTNTSRRSRMITTFQNLYNSR